jgi:tetratricopeptide (TPR) repeat protein
MNISLTRVILGWCFLAASLPAWSRAQSSKPSDAPPAAVPGLRKLSAEDARRAEQLDQEIEKDLQADRWAEAIAKAGELLALRGKVQGPKHFETVSAEQLLKALRRVAPMRHEDRDAYRSAHGMNKQAESFFGQGKYAAAQPLFEKVLEVRRRLLTDDHPDTAQSFVNVAANLSVQGRYAEAQPLHEKALAIRRRLFGDEHPDTATGYHNVAYNLNAQGRYAAAQPLLEKALGILRRLFGEDHPDTAQGYNNLAVNLDAQGRYAAAQPLHEKALAIRRRRFGEEHTGTATSYHNLAYNLNAQGRYAQAGPLYEKALAIHRGLIGDDHPGTATSYHNLAYNLKAQGRYTQAGPLYEKALAVRRRWLGDDHPLTASSYDNLAMNLNAQGKSAAAQPLLEKALGILRRRLGEDHPDTASSYNNVAYNLNAQGKYAAAQPLFEQALAIRHRLVGEDHPETAQNYDNVAGNLDTQGRYAEAQPLHEKALAIRRRVLTEDHPLTAASYNNLAYNLAAQGKYAAARPLLEKALDINCRRLGEDHPHTAQGYNNVAGNLNTQGKYAEAQPLFEKALAIHRRLLGEDHPGTANIRNNLASNLNAQGKYVEARDQWVGAARGFEISRLEKAFTGLDRATAQTQADPRLSLAAVLARLGEPSRAWQWLEQDLGRGLLDELAARRDQRLAPVERDRLRDLAAELERLDRLAEAAPKGLDQAERAKRFEELKHRRELASIALGEFQAKLMEEYGPLAGRVATPEETRAALPAEAALVAWVDLKPVGPNAADPDGEHWGVVVRSRGTPAWVRLPGSGVGRHWSQEDTDLPSLVRDGLAHRPGPGAADIRSSLAKLRAQRLGPLADALGPDPDGLPAARRLIVLPSPALAGIPIEALLEPGDRRAVSYAPSATVLGLIRNRPPTPAQGGLLALGDPVFDEPKPSPDPGPLPDHGLLVTVVIPGSNAHKHGLRPGEVLLSYDGRALHKRDDLKAVDGPGPEVPVDVWHGGQVIRNRLDRGKLGVVVDPRPAAPAIAEQRRLDRILVAARSGSEHFDRLPGTLLEVESLARSFADAGRPARLLTGTEASEPVLERLASSGELRRYAYIHLATHGSIDEAAPARSAVILTQTGLPDPLEQVLHGRPAYDGLLSVREIQRTWELDAELVTLSACESARGKYAGGEGFIGFAQALLISGARGVCLSLWKVDDVATALLMRRFYADLLGRGEGASRPLGKAEALAEAKQWLRGLSRAEAAALAAELTGGVERAKGARRREAEGEAAAGAPADHPYAHPYYWAAIVLVGNPD